MDGLGGTERQRTAAARGSPRAVARLAALAALAIAAILGGGGCASTRMKGTPFFTGEYGKREGPAEDRVNLWPLVYYRKPALSVLWPLIEKTDEHFAVRPVFSVYGLDRPRHTYAVLWPLSQFNMQDRRHWIVPFFWGRNYTVGFPLYWHRRRPHGVTDTLFPLWWYDRDGAGRDLHVLMPVFHVRQRGDREGWRIWPLAGRYREGSNTYGFAAWPLGHAWNKAGSRGSAFFPLYGHARGRGASTFVSLPYSRHRAPAEAWDLVFPLYYRRTDRDGYGFVTPLASMGRRYNGQGGWNAVFPLFYQRRDGPRTLLATPLGGYERDAEGTSWFALPALAGGRYGARGGHAYALGPLAGARWDEAGRHSYAFPLYYHQRDAAESLLLTLPWSAGNDGAGNSWQLAFPLGYHRRNADGTGMLVTPLYSRGSGDGGKRRWNSVFPLYYYRHGEDGRLFATLVGGTSRDRDGRRWLVYPLLSWGRRGPDAGEVWLAAPIFHADWNPAGAAHHLLPLYYWNGRTHTWASPLAARWRNANGQDVALVPPLLTWFVGSPRRSDLWALGGLARWSWGEQAGPQHVFPLYYRHPRAGTTVSLPYASWRRGAATVRAFPPLLSGYSRQADRTSVLALGGLFHNRYETNVANRAGHLFPLYAYKGARQFYTPLFGWNRERPDGFVYPLTPLVGIRRGTFTGSWVFPLYSHRRASDGQFASGHVLWGGYRRSGRYFSSGLFPFYAYHNQGPFALADQESGGYRTYGRDLIAFPGFWYRNQLTLQQGPDARLPADARGLAGQRTVRTQRRANGLFPLWSYSRQDVDAGEHTRVRSTVLLALYDYLRRAGPDPGAAGKPWTEYVRSRVLWRVWHYERSDDEVSVDVFPGVTYDRRGDRFKKISFLWRFFRYERDESGARKADALFIPVMRAKIPKPPSERP